MPMLPRIRRGLRGPQAITVSPDREPHIDVLDYNGLRWLNIGEPTPVEMRELSKTHGFSFHELDYEDVLSRRQRPKVDEYPDYMFVVLHFPRYDKAQGRLNTAELDVFIGRDFLITIPNATLPPLSRIFHLAQTDEAVRLELFAQGPGYVLYRVLDALFDYCFPILDKIGQKLDDIENGIFTGQAKEMVRQISNVKQEIIAFRKIIKPELTTLRVLEMKTTTHSNLSSALEVYFDDVIDAGERIWDMLENYKEIIEALEVTNENIVQHRLNDILLVLTIMSATMLPVTLVAGIYGMNVDLPLPGGPHHAFWIIIGMMVVLLGSLIGFFRYRKWF